ncbi:hypothetical protein Asera_37140 [Actinocatenispora sera]|uniref:ScoMcrA-like SRA domain-containing protein n=1 Tax=Actinocatenispora sera TaxID=390989 RepID=A0A810L5E3_9ACTN|nr:hypothetical protein Asera_37140 [Actinocatenispora sera]
MAPGGDVFLYTGEGSEGDQQLQQGNLSLLEHRKQVGAAVVHCGLGQAARRQVASLRGRVRSGHDSPCAQEDAPDALGETRSVWVFRLRPVGRVEYRESDASRRDVVEPVRVPSWWLWNACGGGVRSQGNSGWQGAQA